MLVLLYLELSIMTKSDNPFISVVAPVFNEAAGLQAFNASLLKVLNSHYKDNYEVIYCDDGSTDDTTGFIREFNTNNPRVKLVRLSRNFGKEIATTAGINEAQGDVILTIDSDGQHPVELIPKFVEKWKDGSKVIIGIRIANSNEGIIKKLGSRIFYALFNRFTGVNLLPGSTDFRLIDKAVQQDFIKMTERNRITRGLIDWLGYKRDYIEFRANPRMSGMAGYSFRKLFKLAIDSIISLSISPLYITAYIGAIVLPISTLLGLFMVGNYLLGDPANLHATGGAYILVLVLFLIGVLLVSQGIIGLYLSHIHTETKNRPLYIIDKDRSLT